MAQSSTGAENDDTREHTSEKVQRSSKVEKGLKENSKNKNTKS